MPTINDIHVDAVLTQFSVDYQNSGFVADVVMPRVTVAKESGIYFIYDKAKFNLPESRRSIRSQYHRIDWSVTQGTYQCHEYALEQAIDDRERVQADEPLDTDRDTTQLVTDLVELGREKRVADQLTSASILTQYTALTGSDQWSNETGSDPVGDIITGRNTINDAIGIDPNVLVLGRAVFNRLKEHPQIIERIKYSQLGVVTAELLAAVFEVDKVVIASSLYNTAQEGQDVSLSKVWGKNAVLAYVAPSIGIKIMTLGISLESRPRQTEKYREEKIKSDVVRVSEVMDELVVTASAGYLIQTAVA